MFEVLKDLGFIGGIIMAAVAAVIFIVEKIPDVIKYYRTVGRSRITAKGGKTPELPAPPVGVALKPLKNGLIRVTYKDENGKKIAEEKTFEDLPGFFEEYKAKYSGETVTDTLDSADGGPTAVLGGGGGSYEKMPAAYGLGGKNEYADKPTEFELRAKDQNGQTEILEVKTLSSFEDNSDGEITEVLTTGKSPGANAHKGEDGTPTETLTDKNKAVRYAQSIVNASVTEVLTAKKTEYLN